MKDTIAITILTIIAITLMHPANASPLSWQEKMLFEPTPAQLSMEVSNHRIMIYHGLKDVQVAKAMEQQFDRVEHMMFTGTVITDGQGKEMVDAETGKAMVEDDGC